MDRKINYTGQILLAADLLQMNKNAMIGLAALTKAILGTGTWVDGLECAPTGPPSLQVTVASGSIYTFGNVDGTAYGELGSDTTHQIVKQGVVLDTTTLNCPAPGTVGQSINYLIQGAFQDQDTDSTVLPYFNVDDPTDPFEGPTNSGISQNTTRKGACVMSVKAGTAATTGTQTTPAPDAGFTALWIIAVANGATTITSGNIARYPGAPFILEKLNDKGTGTGTGRTPASGNVNLYVSNAGSDSTGDGTTGAPFRTLQKAVNVLAANYDGAGFDAAVNTQGGTYSDPGVIIAFPFTGFANVTLIGDTTTPSNCTIASSANGIWALNNSAVSIEGFKVTASGGDALIATTSASINVTGKIEFGTTSHYQVSVNTEGVIQIKLPYIISGGCVSHFGGTATGTIIADGGTATITGTPTFSDAFVSMEQSVLRAVGWTFTGSATAKQYQASLNASINVGGVSTAGYFPGSTGGTTATGGEIG